MPKNPGQSGRESGKGFPSGSRSSTSGKAIGPVKLADIIYERIFRSR